MRRKLRLTAVIMELRAVIPSRSSSCFCRTTAGQTRSHSHRPGETGARRARCRVRESISSRAIHTQGHHCSSRPPIQSLGLGLPMCSHLLRFEKRSLPSILPRVMSNPLNGCEPPVLRSVPNASVPNGERRCVPILASRPKLACGRVLNSILRWASGVRRFASSQVSLSNGCGHVQMTSRSRSALKGGERPCDKTQANRTTDRGRVLRSISRRSTGGRLWLLSPASLPTASESCDRRHRRHPN
mmetsp:Transcript_38173/g.111791  ORF Transcript_38173/g.111791 Transcript_38173/m.111791 type:complete len:243 (-) Transcript_38173:161-889(-)